MNCNGHWPASVPKISDLGVYLKALGYLGRVPGWGTQGLRFQFYESMQKMAEIEPLALHFIQDQLRGSPLLFYSQLLDSLQRDANRLAGVRHKLFGKEIGVGFRALNPGLARGTLHARPGPAAAWLRSRTTASICCRRPSPTCRRSRAS